MRADRAIAGALPALERAGSPSPRLDAEVLLAHALKTTREDLLLRPETRLTPARVKRFREFVLRRARREPVGRITGVKEFWSLPLKVGPATLMPRPDSETLVEEALARLGPGARDKPLSVLDLGTGSGCLLLALLTELPGATGLGVDISSEALKVAQANARALGLAMRARFRRFDWQNSGALPGRFDLVVCNPPYVPGGAIAALSPEVAAFDPREALDGGADGLAHYRAIIRRVREFFGDAGGVIAFEIDQGQARAVSRLLRSAGFAALSARRDLAGKIRALSAELPAPG